MSDIRATEFTEEIYIREGNLYGKMCATLHESERKKDGDKVN